MFQECKYSPESKVCTCHELESLSSDSLCGCVITAYLSLQAHNFTLKFLRNNSKKLDDYEK
jgi:hypothetical protein